MGEVDVGQDFFSKLRERGRVQRGVCVCVCACVVVEHVPHHVELLISPLSSPSYHEKQRKRERELERKSGGGGGGG